MRRRASRGCVPQEARRSAAPLFGGALLVRPYTVVVLTRIARLVWMVGFAVGTVTHVLDLVLGGVEVYAGYPDAVRVYWVALTVLDPLVVVGAARRMGAAVVLGVAVMVSDVTINTWVLVSTGALGIAGLAMQIVFGTFVVATAPMLWRAWGRVRPGRVEGGRASAGR